MKFCWEIYNKSECDTCPYYNSVKEGKTPQDKIPEFMKVDEESN
ncbi:MAG TPA: hypothetical protein PKO06_14540 [Candidatus Ozemobacteraceae bacterium]|nr:hypothetical protein [Candidatus Ozemobacteraceae bacterium]